MAPRLSARGLIGTGALLLAACAPRAPKAAQEHTVAVPAATPALARFWNGATVYFLLLDRFANGDSTNDHALGRAHDGALLRNFEGGDLAGVRARIEAGYFDSLGVDAIWMTPFVEQIHGAVDEGTGRTYGYHGYWARDWTAVDPAFGTREELHALVDAAHRHGIRVLMDAVINHVGSPTSVDPAWPTDWVRTSPNCSYKDYATATACTLVPTLPDILTDHDEPVELPAALTDRWRQEGRLEAERASLDSFFHRTGYPRAPRYYFIKWLTDWVREFGFDGYRMDTAKHFAPSVAAELKLEADRAYADWKAAHPGQALDSLPFYMVGEVYGYGPWQGRTYDFGDRKVDYFANGYDALINFSFKGDVAGPLDSVFTRYSASLHGGPLDGVALLNYVSSHDDGSPYDGERKDPLGAGTKLLLAPGGAQIYYGDETARLLKVEGAEGDANLRSLMNWSALKPGSATAATLAHWRKLGRFRHAHPAIGAGEHHTLQASPYIFSRILDTDGIHDRVLVAMDQGSGARTIPVFGVFPDGTPLVDSYSGEKGTVAKGAVTLKGGAPLVLLSEAPVAR